MQRYTPGVLPKQITSQSSQPVEEVRPLAAAERLCEFIRSEHGRAGVTRFLAALAPFVPRDFLEQLARHTGANAPPVRDVQHAERPPHSETPHQAPNQGMKPEQLLKLLNMTGNGGGGGSGGMDPATLLKLMGEMNK